MSDPVLEPDARADQYDICKVRGHMPEDYVLTMDPPLSVCKMCRTQYRIEEVLYEQNVPSRTVVPELCNRCGGDGNGSTYKTPGLLNYIMCRWCNGTGRKIDRLDSDGGKAL